MRILNSVRSHPLQAANGREIRGLVRVRGVDARVRGKGFTLQTHEPVAVLVSGERGVRRLALPQHRSLAAAYVAAPAAFLFVRSLMRKGKP